MWTQRINWHSYDSVQVSSNTNASSQMKKNHSVLKIMRRRNDVFLNSSGALWHRGSRSAFDTNAVLRSIVVFCVSVGRVLTDRTEKIARIPLQGLVHRKKANLNHNAEF